MITTLVRQVSQSIRYSEKIAQLTGGSFNIFQIMGLEASETRTHSAFLAELLNAKGSHGKGTAFMELFLKQIDVPEFSLYDLSVEVEKHIGFIDPEWKEGGRIDIIIRNGAGQAIAIENKIYAGDQKNQLLRYHTYCSTRFKEFHLLYLTLDGREPSDWSRGNKEGSALPFACKHISYSTDIVEWLLACNKEVALQPLIRETIVQYINLIKHLTGQNMDQSVTNEITDGILKDGADSIKAVFEIHNTIYPVISRKLVEELTRQLENLLPPVFELTPPDVDWFGVNNTGFSFTKTNWRFISIGFGIENRKLYYGVSRRKKSWDTEIPPDIIQKLNSQLGNVNGTATWPWWEWDAPVLTRDQIYLGIQDGNFAKHVGDKLNDLLDRLKPLDHIL